MGQQETMVTGEISQRSFTGEATSVVQKMRSAQGALSDRLLS